MGFQTDQAGTAVSRHGRVRGWHGLLLAALLIVTGLASGGVAVAHTTQGSAIPSNDGAHPWPSDGCSTPGMSIDSVASIFSFHHACVHHDGCYIGFPGDGRPTYWTTRLQCDTWFLYDMQASCRWQHGTAPVSWAARECLQWADNYLWAVRTYGSSGYKGPWNN